MRRVIDGGDRYDWQLAVCNGDVTASFHHPSEESIYYTTADFGLTRFTPGDDCLSPEIVVACYRRQSGTEAGYRDLLARVQQALEDPAETTQRPVATDGGTDR